MRSLVFHAYKYFNGSKSKLAEIKKLESFDRERLEEFKKARLRELILYAYSNVQYYKPLFDEVELVNNGEVNFENFPKLPILNKADIKENFDILKSQEIEKRQWHYKTTGGSTGEPLKVIHDKERTQWVNAIKDLRNQWSEVKFGESKIRLWGSERDLFYGKETLKTKANRWLVNTVWLNAFTLNPKKMFEFVEVINRKKPANIKAYTTCLYELALFIEKNNLSVYSPKTIVCSAGTLTELVRKKIEQVFRAKIFNSYGSREIQAMAFECGSHNGLHVMSPIVHFEILIGLQ